jgi:hypothetical protein
MQIINKEERTQGRQRESLPEGKEGGRRDKNPQRDTNMGEEED